MRVVLAGSASAKLERVMLRMPAADQRTATSWMSLSSLRRAYQARALMMTVATQMWRGSGTMQIWSNTTRWAPPL